MKKKQPRPYEDWAEKIGCVVSSASDAHAFAVIVQGNDMVPYIQDGDWVVFEPSREPKDGEVALIKLKDDTLLLRRYYQSGLLVQLVPEKPRSKVVQIARTEIVFAYPAFEIHTTATPRARRVN
jgi:SOS-response transcriptional repressor LexA